ncbi:hypothetical protein HMPREF1640_04850 [Prevotella sp. S7-1-8]|nr:hypothetical protein HMPREF1640_04850 [Prevotella sp. S7-1-8]
MYFNNIFAPQSSIPSDGALNLITMDSTGVNLNQKFHKKQEIITVKNWPIRNLNVSLYQHKKEIFLY